MGRLPHRQRRLKPTGWTVAILQTVLFVLFLAGVVALVVAFGPGPSCDNVTWTCW